MFLSKFQRGPWACSCHLVPFSSNAFSYFHLVTVELSHSPFPFLLIRTLITLPGSRSNPTVMYINRVDEGGVLGGQHGARMYEGLVAGERSAWSPLFDDFLFCLPSSFSYLLSLPSLLLHFSLLLSTIVSFLCFP